MNIEVSFRIVQSEDAQFDVWKVFMNDVEIAEFRRLKGGNEYHLWKHGRSGFGHSDFEMMVKQIITKQPIFTKDEIPPTYDKPDRWIGRI